MGTLPTMLATVVLAVAIGAFHPASAFMEGFVPMLSSSAFTRPQRGRARAASPITHGSWRIESVRAACPSSALQMNLADRFFRVARANLNKLLQRWEDPEKILQQAVDDMQNDLVKIRQSYAEVSASQKRMERQQTEADRLAKSWHDRAQMALQNGNESLAREALTRRQIQLDTVANLEQQLSTQGAALSRLAETTQQLEGKITEARGQKDTLIARARTAKTASQVHDMLGSVVSTTSMGAFGRMEEKVEALEAKAEISGEATGGSLSLESEFKALEGQSTVDMELAKLKGLLPTKKIEKHLLSSSSGPEVEFELDQMQERSRAER